MVISGFHSGLGHRRLAIIDLTTSASQPMVDSTKHFCIVFNGEIYNYKDLKTQLENLGCQFTSESDTEVLLEAFKVWGWIALPESTVRSLLYL